ncbi:MAG: IS3 family transposase [Saprospiraceae bacterium]|nr:IS3 family transposase [Saprospiraceae bacterium]
MKCSINFLYKSLGISKQAVYQHMMRALNNRNIEQQVILLIYKIRKDHPTMGCRDMYYKIKPPGLGRDRFEELCLQEGLKSIRRKNYRRTTDSTGVCRFPNLIKNLKIERPNQVWQSDITYYELNGRFYYLTFIQDSFTKKILGHQVSKNLTTESTTLASIKKAIKNRWQMNFSRVIFHSDGGGQYYDKEFLKITASNNMQNSMCEMAWENGLAERLNGVIKNNYLRHKKIETFEMLTKEVDRIVELYNSEKPHIKLKRRSPIEFEKYYICNKRKTDGDKSATDKKLVTRAVTGPTNQKRKTSGSNIALD